ncbi:MAG: hypothetical protein ACE5IZ_00725, partial [Dehalococcoidia bacterium]
FIYQRWRKMQEGLRKRLVKKPSNTANVTASQRDLENREQLFSKGGDSEEEVQRQRLALAQTVDGDLLSFLARLNAPQQRGLLALMRTAAGEPRQSPGKH